MIVPFPTSSTSFLFLHILPVEYTSGYWHAGDARQKREGWRCAPWVQFHMLQVNI